MTRTVQGTVRRVWRGPRTTVIIAEPMQAYGRTIELERAVYTLLWEEPGPWFASLCERVEGKKIPLSFDLEETSSGWRIRWAETVPAQEIA